MEEKVKEALEVVRALVMRDKAITRQGVYTFLRTDERDAIELLLKELDRVNGAREIKP